MAKQSSTGNTGNEVDSMLTDEKAKIKLLKNIVNAFIQKKVTIDNDRNMTIDMTADEVLKITSASKNIMDMERKSQGYE